mgnify:CR=1 FL=1
MVGEPDVNTRYAAVNPTGNATASLALWLPIQSSSADVPLNGAVVRPSHSIIARSEYTRHRPSRHGWVRPIAHIRRVPDQAAAPD